MVGIQISLKLHDLCIMLHFNAQVQNKKVKKISYYNFQTYKPMPCNVEMSISFRNQIKINIILVHDSTFRIPCLFFQELSFKLNLAMHQNNKCIFITISRQFFPSLITITQAKKCCQSFMTWFDVTNLWPNETQIYFIGQDI